MAVSHLESPHPHIRGRRRKKKVAPKTDWNDEEKRRELSNLKAFLLLQRSKAFNRNDEPERLKFQRFLDLLRCLE